MAPKLGCWTVKEGLVDVAPDPAHATFLVGPDQGMAGGLEVLEGVLVLRLLTATDVPAGQAHSQGRPAVAKRDALLTHLCGRPDVVDQVEMGTRPLGEPAGPGSTQEHVDQLVDRCHSRLPRCGRSRAPTLLMAQVL